MNNLFRYVFFLSLALFFASCSQEKSSSDKLAPTMPEAAEGDGALRSANEAIASDPDNPANYKRRATLLLERNDYAQALADINHALELDSTKADFYYLKARALRGQNQVPAALKTAIKAEQKGLADAGLYLAMGEMYLIIKQYQKSIDYLNKSLELAPFNEQAYFYKGMVYAESNDTTRAISSYQTAIEQKPSFTDAYNALIAIYNAKKDRKMASQYLNSALRFAPEDPYLLFNKGIVLRNEGKADSAIATFQRAMYLDSTLYQAAYNLGTLAYQKENYKLAAEALQKAINKDNQLPGIESLLAYSYEQTGNYELAEKYYIKASDENPGDKEVIAGFNRVKAKLSGQGAAKP